MTPKMSCPKQDRLKLKGVLKLLSGQFGRPQWRRGGSAVHVLVATILSQNTTDANSSAGFRRLRERFGSWSALADAPVGSIRRCIRSCGLGRIKAPRIKSILRQIRADRGKVTLEFLRHMNDGQAYEYLTRFDGVGPKTALCVQLFALGMPVFPVDTHIFRIAGRLGVLPGSVPADRAHEALTSLIPPKDRYALHLLLIAHGRATCRARNPKCGECVLLDLCPHGRKLTA